METYDDNINLSKQDVQRVKFDNELSSLDSAMKELDSIIQDMQQEISNAREKAKTYRGGGSSPYTFLFQMFGNLISANSSRISIIKQISQIKKLDFDLSKKGGSDEENMEAIAKHFYSILKQDKRGESGEIKEVAVDSGNEEEFISYAKEIFEKENGYSIDKQDDQRVTNLEEFTAEIINKDLAKKKDVQELGRFPFDSLIFDRSLQKVFYVTDDVQEVFIKEEPGFSLKLSNKGDKIKKVFYNGKALPNKKIFDVITI